MRYALSILIATIPERRDQFEKLVNDLTRWPIEVLSDNRPRMAVSVGLKRQSLLEIAQGDYVCFHDDDDWHSPNYVPLMLKAIEDHAPDCIGFEITCKGMGRSINRSRNGFKLAAASKRYDKWGDNVEGYDYVRSTYHKTPVKREIALKAGFKDLRFAEDHDYSMSLKATGLLKTEVFIPEPLYIYRYHYEPHNIKYGITE